MKEALRRHPDTLIAGIALAHGAQLATRTRCHFSDTIISLINPFAPMACAHHIWRRLPRNL